MSTTAIIRPFVSLSALALAACASTGNVPVHETAFTLWSPQFTDNSRLEDRHAGNLRTNPNCVGRNVSPALAWKNLPAGTKSLAVLVHDQQGRNGLGVVHWVAYGIDPAVGGFQENEISAASPKYTEGRSTLELGSYMGPCPPANTG